MINPPEMKPEQADFIRDIEELIKKSVRIVPAKEDSGGRYPQQFAWGTVGASVKDGQIIEINLNQCQLTSLPKSISHCIQLKTLNLVDNEIDKLPESIGTLKILEFLNLQRNALTELPNAIGNLESLKYLNLSGNALQSLPVSIGWLKNLEVLGLSENHLRNLPATLGDLSMLYSLSLSKNELHVLPQSFGKLSSLKSCKLNSNRLVSLPESIGGMVNLQFLELRHNKLSTFPESIVKLQRLMELFLDHNDFSVPPLNTWHLSNLEILSLGGNPLGADYQEIINHNITTVLDYFREKSTIKVFLSHAVTDFEYFQVKKVSEYLESLEDVYQAFFCEEDLVGDIDRFMNETIPKCHVLLFFATRNSAFNSVDCAHELNLAGKLNIPIYTVRGKDLDKEALEKSELPTDHMIEYSGQVDDQYLGLLSETVFQNKILSAETNKRVNGEEDLKDSEENRSFELIVPVKKVLMVDQAAALAEIECLIGNKLPRTSWEDLDSNGVYIEDNNIISLHLKGCGLKSLPDSIGNLPKLKNLVLAENEIKQLPDSICRLTSLEYVNLESNHLKTLPRCLWKWKKLKFITLTFNPWEADLAPFEGIRAGFPKDYIEEIFQALWNRSSVNILGCCTPDDHDRFKMKKITELLQKEGEIHQVVSHKEKNGPNFKETIASMQILLFFASDQALRSEQCNLELDEAGHRGIQIIPIKGPDISWGELEKVRLNRELGMEYSDENIEDFCTNLIKYIKQLKRETNLFYPGEKQPW